VNDPVGVLLDVVVVTYNSREHVRPCVQPLCNNSRIEVIVVDNDSADGTPDAIRDLPLKLIESRENRGFAAACNTGFGHGDAPFVCFLNPDAVATPEALLSLVARLEVDDRVGCVAPRVVEPDGSTQYTQHWFPTLRTTFARALFLHRLIPSSSTTFDVVDPAQYQREATPDWVAGACLVLRRRVLERLHGFDERFFMYCEDMDLCKRIRDLGLGVVYDPNTEITHVGGASAPKTAQITRFSRSRILYAQKHRSGLSRLVELLGIALDAGTHMILTSQGWEARRRYAAALRTAARATARSGSG
jgi:N-acetylglucosaminyl-diphospho-decaprenol L-rhamnosyltransferase